MYTLGFIYDSAVPCCETFYAKILATLASKRTLLRFILETVSQIAAFTRHFAWTTCCRDMAEALVGCFAQTRLPKNMPHLTAVCIRQRFRMSMIIILNSA